MTSTKTYFLCPISEFIHPPPTGPLCLGSIIRSTSAPQYPLNRAKVVPVPEVDLFPPDVEKDWKKTVSSENGFGLGVYAQFLTVALGILPFGPDVSAQHSKRTVNDFAFDTVTTFTFEPTQEYVQEAIQAPAVQTWLREPKQRFSPSVTLFLVTSIKLVKGARIRYSTSHNTQLVGNLGTDMPFLGVTIGPKGHWVSMDDHETELVRESEFVFAFRVKRLRIGRNIKVEEYSKGAFLAVGGKQENEVSVLVEDMHGPDIMTTTDTFDVTENGRVYCVPAQ